MKLKMIGQPKRLVGEKCPNCENKTLVFVDSYRRHSGAETEYRITTLDHAYFIQCRYCECLFELPDKWKKESMIWRDR